MNPVFLIASNTFRDAIRQKLILLVALIAVALVISSKYFLRLDLGHEQLRFIFDFGSGATSFFGSIIAIVATCQLFHSEMENRTIITLMSKPVSYAQFTVGKLVGACAVLALFCTVIAAATAGMLEFTQLSMGDAAKRLSAGLEVNYAGVFACAFVQWLKLCAIASLAALVCAVSHSLLFSVIVSFMCVAISLMGAVTLGLGSEPSAFTEIVSKIFPDLQVFGAAEAFAFSQISTRAFFGACGYAAIYIVACGGLSAWLFSKREF